MRFKNISLYIRRRGGVVLTRPPTKRLPIGCTGSNPVVVDMLLFNIITYKSFIYYNIIKNIIIFMKYKNKIKCHPPY